MKTIHHIRQWLFVGLIVLMGLNIVQADIADAVIQKIDNGDAQRVEINGDWQVSIWTGGGEFYENNYIHDKNAGKGQKNVRFTPDALTGSHSVYLRYTSGANRADNVPVDIHHAEGVTTKTVNQKQNGGKWIFLGSYEFIGDSSEYVEIRNDDTNGYVIADAVAFIELSSGTPCLPNLVSYWNFDQPGEVIIDQAGGNTGWVKGAVEAPGIADACLEFDNDDSVLVADDETLRLSGEFSLCAWIKESVPSQYAKIVSRRDGDYFYFLGVDNGRPYAGVGDGDSYATTSKSKAMPSNEWHHLAAAYRADTDSLKLFYDGELIETATVTEDLPYTEGIALSIGSDEEGTQMFFTGSIDELAVFDAALSDDDIMTLYIKGLAGNDYCAESMCGNGIVDPGEDCDGGGNCPPNCRYGECYATSVVSYTPGLRKDGTAILTERSDPQNALGAPQGTDDINFVSLGFGGILILEFDSKIINRAGADFKITETSYSEPSCDTYPETAHVYGSKDGSAWEDLGTGCLDSEYDLGTLDYATFIKIVDESDPSAFGNSDEGFDVDGIEAFSCAPQNSAPVAEDLSITLDEDSQISFEISASDSDGDTLLYAIQSDPTNGVLTGTPPSVTYQPNDNYNGLDSFTFTASDGNLDSNTAVVLITVNSVNDLPVANNDTGVTAIDVPIIIDVLINDTDIDGDSLGLVSITQPANGTATDIGDGRVSYTPDAGFVGEDSFTYTLEDGCGGSSTADVHITVTGSDTPPVISFSPDAAIVAQGETVTLTWTVSNSDYTYIDNGIGSVSSSGSITVDAEYTTVYTLTATGPYGTVSAEAEVQVTGNTTPQSEGSFGYPYNDLIPPDATIDSYDESLFAVVSGSVTDIDGSPIEGVSITIHTIPEYGTVVTGSDGQFEIPVEGGGPLTIVYRKADLISVQRDVDVPANDLVAVDTVQMIGEDTASTTLSFNGDPVTVVTHYSTPFTDGSGTRAATLIFTGDTEAYMTDENGNTIQPLTTITTRATVFPSPESLPGSVSPDDDFGYCVELSVDGAERVSFSKPVIVWVDNYLGYDVGEVVPVGYYDRDAGEWMSSENGYVVKLLDTDTDGVVDALDASGDGQPDDLDGDGTFSSEVIGLEDNTRYAPDATFARVGVTHFTPWYYWYIYRYLWNITTDTVWTLSGSPYYVPTNLTVEGTDGPDGVTTLTIEPGVVVKFGQGTQMTIGSSYPGALVAKGTASAPIVFTSGKATPAAGDWRGIRFNDRADDDHSVLSYCEVGYAGISNYGAVTVINANPVISDSRIHHSIGYGIFIQNAAPDIIGTDFHDNDNYDVYYDILAGGNLTGNTIRNGIRLVNGAVSSISGNTFVFTNSRGVSILADLVGEFFYNNTISGVTSESALDVYGHTVTRDAVWPAVMPYRIHDSISIQGADGDDVAMLTIAAGAILKFDNQKGLNVGNSYPGALIAQGTISAPIVFTSVEATPAAGDWYGIEFKDKAADDQSVMSHCEVSFGGSSGTGGVTVDHTNPVISSSQIHHNLGYGVFVRSAAPDIIDTDFHDNGNYDVYYYAPSGGNLTGNTIRNGIYLVNGTISSITGNTFEYNKSVDLLADFVGEFFNQNTITGVTSSSYINVEGSYITRDATWPAVMPYYIPNNLRIQGTDGPDGETTLTIAAGATLKFGKLIYLIVGSNDFGALVAEGTESAPIVFTSGEETPAEGDWFGIRFDGRAGADSSILSYCEVSYAGATGIGGVNIINANPVISNSQIHHSLGYGIYIYTAAPDIIGSDFHDNGDYDVYYNLPSGGNLTGNTIRNGIRLVNGTVSSITGNTFEYTNSIDLLADFIGEFFNQNTITGVTPSSVIHVRGSYVTRDATWPAVMPYLIHSSLTIQGTDGADEVTTLTIADGAILRFDKNLWLTVGSSSPGALVAEGTESAPIIFTSGEEIPAAGDWQGIRFNDKADDDLCVLNYCEVGYTGTSSQAAIYVYQSNPEIGNTHIHHSLGHGIYAYYADILVTNCEIENSETHGIYISACAPDIIDTDFHDNGSYDIYYHTPSGGNLTGNTIRNGIRLVNGTVSSITGNTFEYNDSWEVNLLADFVGELFSQNTITGVTPDSEIHVWGSSVTRDATWPAVMPYRMHSSITIQSTDAEVTTTLEIADGAKLKFDENVQLTVGSSYPGALVAEGTASAPIVFTSAQTTPAAGDWQGIRFNDKADDDLCVLNHCDVGYAGTSSYGAVYVYQSNPEISNTRIHHSLGYGIRISRGDILVENCEIDNCETHGIYIELCAPDIIGANFHDNGGYDIYYGSNPEGGSITGNTIHNGLRLVNGTVSSLTGNTIEYNDDRPFHMLADLVGQFFDGNTVTNITTESIMHVWGSTITKDATWPALMLYQIHGNVAIQGDDGDDDVTTLTIREGATLEFLSNSQLTIGASSGNPGALVAEGFPESPIVFTSAQTSPAAGDWYGIRFNDTALDDLSRIVHCEIGYAGTSSLGAIHAVNASPEISNTRIHHSRGYGIYAMSSDILLEDCEIDRSGSHGIYALYGAPDIYGTDFRDNGDYDIYYASPTGGNVNGNTIRNNIFLKNGAIGSITGNTIEFNNERPFYILADVTGEFLNDNTFSHLTSESAVDVWGSTITRDATWSALMPIRIRSNVTVQGTDGSDEVTTLTIGSGAILKFDTGIRLTVGASSGDPGALVADGSQKTIIFTSMQETPAAGDWDRIQFSNTSDDGICFLKNCTFEYGGSGNYGSLYCYNASPTVRYCQFFNGAHAGLYMSSAGSNDAIINNNDFSENLYGIYLTGSAQPLIENNNFLGNTNYELYNASSILVTAENNWWGNSGDPSTDNIYGNVDYDPWLTSQGAGWPTVDFSASPETISGGTSTLTWSTANATSVSIAPNIGAVAMAGSMEVSPEETTTYAMTATGPAGTVTKAVTVTVYIVTGPEGITYEYDALGRITRIVRNPGNGN